MCDLELNFFLNLGGHPVKLRENEAIDNSTSRRPSRTKLAVRLYRLQVPTADTAELRKRAEVSLDKLRCFEYASCWTMAKAENALMWKAYAARHRYQNHHT
jgi:hypothetical protein